MLARGVSVSLDTLLRGMLTPTEYRLRKKQQELEEKKELASSEELRESTIVEEDETNKLDNADELTKVS